MDQPTPFPSALSRLESALERLEKVAGNVGNGANAALNTIEAERDLLQLKHRRLVQSTERAISDLDALIASVEG